MVWVLIMAVLAMGCGVTATPVWFEDAGTAGSGGARQVFAAKSVLYDEEPDAGSDATATDANEENEDNAIPAESDDAGLYDEDAAAPPDASLAIDATVDASLIPDAAQDGSQDAGSDASIDPVCECSEGPCCDGCDFLPAETVCDSYLYWRCGGLPCGNRFTHTRADTQCTGSSAACDGPTTITYFEDNRCPSRSWCKKDLPDSSPGDALLDGCKYLASCL